MSAATLAAAAEGFTRRVPYGVSLLSVLARYLRRSRTFAVPGQVA